MKYDDNFLFSTELLHFDPTGVASRRGSLSRNIHRVMLFRPRAPLPLQQQPRISVQLYHFILTVSQQGVQAVRQYRDS